MKINRLFEIVAILLNKNVVTAKELANRFAVSTRTIYRDIDVLSTAGVPVYTNKGSGGGISLLDNYVLNKTMVSEKDVENILMTLQTLQAAHYTDVDNVMQKLASLFKNIEIQDWIEVDISEWGSSSSNKDKFNSIKKAIISQNCLKFKYYNSEGFKSEREVEPLKLIFKGQSWYVWSFCKQKNDFRIFKINRMKDFEVLNKRFNRESHTKKIGYQYEINKNYKAQPIKLKMRFHEKLLYTLYDYFNEEDIVFNSSGTVEVEFIFPHTDWIYNFILSFGADVEVLEPKHVREEVKKRLLKTFSLY